MFYLPMVSIWSRGSQIGTLNGKAPPCFTSQWSQYGPNGLKGPKLGLSMVKHHSVLPPNAMILRYTTPAAFHFFPQLAIKLLLAGGPRCLIDIFWFLVFWCHYQCGPRCLNWHLLIPCIFVSRYNPVHFIMISWPRWTKMLGPKIMDIFWFLVFWCHDNPVHYIMIFSKLSR